MEIAELQRQIDALRSEVNSLKSGAGIPYDVEQAFRQRLKLSTIPTLTVSGKSSSSENLTVNESGSGSYSVLQPPNGFTEYTPQGSSSIIYIPYYT